MHHLQYKTLLN